MIVAICLADPLMVTSKSFTNQVMDKVEQLFENKYLLVSVRPDFQSRVNNSCIVFVQSLLSLVMKGSLD